MCHFANEPPAFRGKEKEKAVKWNSCTLKTQLSHGDHFTWSNEEGTSSRIHRHRLLWLNVFLSLSWIYFAMPTGGYIYHWVSYDHSSNPWTWRLQSFTLWVFSLFPSNVTDDRWASYTHPVTWLRRNTISRMKDTQSQGTFRAKKNVFLFLSLSLSLSSSPVTLKPWKCFKLLLFVCLCLCVFVTTAIALTFLLLKTWQSLALLPSLKTAIFKPMARSKLNKSNANDFS